MNGSGIKCRSEWPFLFRALSVYSFVRGNSKEISQNSKSIPERKPWSNVDLRPDMGSLKHAPYAYKVFITPIFRSRKIFFDFFLVEMPPRGGARSSQKVTLLSHNSAPFRLF